MFKLCVFLTFSVMISAPYLWIAPVCFILFYYFFKLKKILNIPQLTETPNQ